MRFLDLLSIISGLASIASLLLSVWQRFSAWRKYIQPLAWGLAGFAAGRLSVSFTQPAASSATIQYPSTELILFFVILAVISFASFAMLRRNEPIWAYLLFSLGLSSAGPIMIKTYSEISKRIPVEDLVLLSRDKEQVGDFSGAIFYAEKAASETNDSHLRSQLDARKKALEDKLVQSANESPATAPR
jgi:hypothetical protein